MLRPPQELYNRGRTASRSEAWEGGADEELLEGAGDLVSGYK